KGAWPVQRGDDRSDRAARTGNGCQPDGRAERIEGAFFASPQSTRSGAGSRQVRDSDLRSFSGMVRGRGIAPDRDFYDHKQERENRATAASLVQGRGRASEIGRGQITEVENRGERQISEEAKGVEEMT